MKAQKGTTARLTDFSTALLQAEESFRLDTAESTVASPNGREARATYLFILMELKVTRVRILVYILFLSQEKLGTWGKEILYKLNLMENISWLTCSQQIAQNGLSYSPLY